MTRFSVGACSTARVRRECGNAVLESDEGCDDGNVLAFDGCSPTCMVEPLDACPGLPISLAPPGITIKGTLAG